MRLFAGPAPRLFRRMVDCRSRRSFWLRRCRAARSPWSGQHVRTSRIGRRLLDGWVHLFRTNDAVRPVQVFAQALGRRSRVGAGGAVGVGGALGASANAELATRMTLATNRRSREPMVLMLS